MRKTILLSTFFCFASAIAMQASTRDLVLVDAKGAVVADNAVVSFNKVEADPFDPDAKQIKAELSVCNNSGKDIDLALTVDLVDINGKDAALKVCFPEGCDIYDAKKLFKKKGEVVHANDTNRSIETELTFADNANCTAILRFYTSKGKEADGTAIPDKLLTTVTLKFNSDATGIKSAPTSTTDTTNEVWTVQGASVGRNIADLNSLPKGVYIVLRNGKTTKFIVNN